ncbi:MAG: class I SAM-dependent methyltransferase [Promethearchaeota archaeon]
MDFIELNKKAWDSIAEKDKVINVYVGKNQNLLLKLFIEKLPENATVLDLGCGYGIPITKKLVECGFRVIGIDFSKAMIEKARRNVPQAIFFQNSMTDISFNDEFDGIVSSFSMLCLDPMNFRVTCSKIRNALKIGGFLILFLNEPSPEGHREEDNITTVLGEQMYSRPYTENEIRDAFGLGMDFLRVEREVSISNEYGEEHTLLMLMKKVS